MARIASRVELGDWLRNKPIACGSVIAVRAALRVLPYAFDGTVPDRWVINYALSLIRATVLCWAASNFFAFSNRGGTSAVAAATRAVDEAGIGSHARVATRVARAALNAAFAETSGIRNYAADASGLGAYATNSADNYAQLSWYNINYDCERLANQRDSASVSNRLAGAPLWSTDVPSGWDAALTMAVRRLFALDQSYGVWIEWYARRVRGERSAFYIHGDYDGIKDKKILARLVEATDEDFWNRGATYVNTTLEGWIEESQPRSVRANPLSGNKIAIPEASKSNISQQVDFFISYATIDEMIAREIESVLTELGYTSIVQFKDFPQSNFVRSMREGIPRSERFIALYSRAYWNSDFCKSEWDAAFARDPSAEQRKIVPFLLEPMDLTTQALVSEIVFEPIYGLSKESRKKAIVRMIQYKLHYQ
jgi:TIR domain